MNKPSASHQITMEAMIEDLDRVKAQNEVLRRVLEKARKVVKGRLLQEVKEALKYSGVKEP